MAARRPRHAPFYRRARACPSPSNDRGEPARMRGWKLPRAHARRGLKRSRGTGPRATVKRTAPFIVGRGPVPRHATLARDRPSRYGAVAVFVLTGASRGTGPRATVLRTAIFAVSPHQTSSASDLTRKQDPATAASLTSPVSHQTRLPRSGSNTQHPALQTYR